MAEKTKVVLLQDGNGQVRQVRIGETVLDVITAVPIVIAGGMAVSLTIGPADLTVEKQAAVDPANTL